MKLQRLALVGCGLMGGSFALALRQAGAVGHIAGTSRSKGSVNLALDLGVIDEACTRVCDAVKLADLVLLAVPVASTESLLREIAPCLMPGALVMDVGSTKRDVVDAARRAMGSQLSHFVPAHPVAGKESAGIGHASADLYRQRHTVLTPLPENPPEATGQARTLWELVGSTVHLMSPEDHDATFAAVSHLPHLLAFAYMLGITGQADAVRHLSMAGPGFRDFTRIAASDPTIWRDILSANRDLVQEQLKLFRAELANFEEALLGNDHSAIEGLISLASATRSSWQASGREPEGS